MRSRETTPSPKTRDGRDFEPAARPSPACPHCGSTELIENDGSEGTVCASCGFVVEEGSLVAPRRWGDLDRDESGEAIGAGPPETPTLHDRGLPTEVSPKDRDGRGNSLSSEERALARKLRRWQKRCRVSGGGERNLAMALKEIDRMASQLGVPRSVRRTASRLYEKAADEGLVVGRSVEAVSTAALYTACRDSQLPRTLSEIVDLIDVSEKKTWRAYRSLVRSMDLDISPSNPADYVQRFGDELDLSEETRSKAIDVIRKAREKNLVSGRSPTTTAVAALYIAACLKASWTTSNEENILQRKAEDAIDVPQQTVSERFRQIAEGLDIDVRFQSWMLAPIKHEDASQQEAERSESQTREKPPEMYGQEKLSPPHVHSPSWKREDGIADASRETTPEWGAQTELEGFRRGD